MLVSFDRSSIALGQVLSTPRQQLPTSYAFVPQRTELISIWCNAATTTSQNEFKGWQLPASRGSLGLAVKGDRMQVLIPAQAVGPCTVKEVLLSANTCPLVSPSLLSQCESDTSVQSHVGLIDVGQHRVASNQHNNPKYSFLDLCLPWCHLDAGCGRYRLMPEGCMWTRYLSEKFTLKFSD